MMMIMMMIGERERNNLCYISLLINLITRINISQKKRKRKRKRNNYVQGDLEDVRETE